jgi:hypothetical protein
VNAVVTFLTSLTLKLIGPLLAYLKGRGDAELQNTKDSLEDIREVKNIHDRIERDPAERVRLRDKYK